MASERERQFLRLLDPLASPSFIDMRSLRQMCYAGIPDHPRIRPLCWKLLLAYLPPDKSLWKRHLDSRRRIYEDFVRDILATPVQPGEQGIEVRDVDDDILDQIHRDARRTLPHIELFQRHVQPSDYSPLTCVSNAWRAISLVPAQSPTASATSPGILTRPTSPSLHQLLSPSSIHRHISDVSPVMAPADLSDTEILQLEALDDLCHAATILPATSLDHANITESRPTTAESPLYHLLTVHSDINQDLPNVVQPSTIPAVHPKM